MKLTPNIHFQGNAKEALNFYATAFNGTAQQIGRFGESPMECDEDWKQKFIPARLVFENNMIMISESRKCG
ncbi:MAG: hypothetical protein ABI760_15590 [Ferruginibacter sp.]